MNPHDNTIPLVLAGALFGGAALASAFLVKKASAHVAAPTIEADPAAVLLQPHASVHLVLAPPGGFVGVHPSAAGRIGDGEGEFIPESPGNANLSYTVGGRSAFTTVQVVAPNSLTPGQAITGVFSAHTGGSDADGWVHHIAFLIEPLSSLQLSPAKLDLCIVPSQGSDEVTATFSPEAPDAGARAAEGATQASRLCGQFDVHLSLVQASIFSRERHPSFRILWRKFDGQTDSQPIQL